MANKKTAIHTGSKWRRLSAGDGLTLVEIIIYVAFLGIFLVVLVNFWIQLANTYARARAEREVISNARLLLETVTARAARARETYAPTSRFNNDAGQLSLVVPIENDASHASQYTDFWVDNGRLWMREEGGSSLALSASSVRITKFSIAHIAQSYGREAVAITLDVASVSAKIPASITLHATVAMRGNY